MLSKKFLSKTELIKKSFLGGGGEGKASWKLWILRQFLQGTYTSWWGEKGVKKRKGEYKEEDTLV